MRQFYFIFLILIFSLQCLHAKSNKPTASKLPPIKIGEADQAISPISLTSNYNKLFRSYVDPKKIDHIDLFTGKLTLHIPIIHIPANDGINLNVTLSYDNFEPAINGLGSKDPRILDYTPIRRASFVGVYWYLFSGIIATVPNIEPIPRIYQPENPIFIDPTGKQHQLYPNQGAYYAKDNWYATLSRSGHQFQGIVYSPDGTQYEVSPGINRGSHGGAVTSPLRKITSPHAGTVIKYTYSGAQLTKITLNNGFTVKFIYEGGLQKITTSDAQIWAFSKYRAYPTPSDPANADNIITKYLREFSAITLPDGRQWQFEWKGLPRYQIVPSKITYPNGGEAHYQYGHTYKQYSNDETLPGFGTHLAPVYVISKKLTGKNFSDATWTYHYETGAWTACGNDGMGRKSFGSNTIVTGPNKKIIYRFNPQGNQEIFLGKCRNLLSTVLGPVATPSTGLLLKKNIYSLENQQPILLESTEFEWGLRFISPQIGYNYPHWDNSLHRPYNPNSGVFAPFQTKKIIKRNGLTYTTVYSEFNDLGLPQKIKETSNSGEHRKAIKYYINKNKWIIKPENEITVDQNNTVINSVSREYDNNANLMKQSINGTAIEYQYDNVGNLLAIINALGQTTYFNDYMAGIPQTFIDAMGHQSHIMVNSNGTMSSFTNALGQMTAYEYDTCYRPIKISPPIHAETTIEWNKPTAGSQTITRSNYQKVIRVNDFGQTIQTIAKDLSGNNPHPRIFQNFKYDAEGRLIFKSYPAYEEALDAIGGIWTKYDALGRVMSISEGR